ncbi:caffeoylshikimate esterase-like protein [Tanacetum coccineum]
MPPPPLPPATTYFWGETPEEEFYKSQGVQNSKLYYETPNGKLFTQSWTPLDQNAPIKGVVFMTHGYGSDTSWCFQKICIEYAKWGYAVFAADLLGHGRSDGLHGYLGDMDKVAATSLTYFLSVRKSETYCKLPAFLFGESMGGMITMLMYFQSEPDTWTGLIFSAPLFVIPENMVPSKGFCFNFLFLRGVLLLVVSFAVMGDRRPFNYKEDLTQKISTSVFVTNFPDHCTARDLWNVCLAYGKVIDVYIPFKQSFMAWEPRASNSMPMKGKDGAETKSFAFVLKSNHLNSSAFEWIPRHACVLDDHRSICAWNKDAIAKIVSPWGTLSDVDTADDDSLPYQKVCVATKVSTIINDRIKIIVKGKIYWIRIRELEAWSPEFDDEFCDTSSVEESVGEEEEWVLFKRSFCWGSQVDILCVWDRYRLVKRTMLTISDPLWAVRGLEDKVVKALYGLHQALRAWYATLSTFLEQSGYRRGTIDKTLFIKKDKRDIMLVQVYVDDIIFGSTKKSWCDEFEALMKSRFQMSSMGERTFFLGLQVKQKEDGIFISQDKYVADILKKFDFMSVKHVTPRQGGNAGRKQEWISSQHTVSI